MNKIFQNRWKMNDTATVLVLFKENFNREFRLKNEFHSNFLCILPLAKRQANTYLHERAKLIFAHNINENERVSISGKTRPICLHRNYSVPIELHNFYRCALAWSMCFSLWFSHIPISCSSIDFGHSSRPHSVINRSNLRKGHRFISVAVVNWTISFM